MQEQKPRLILLFGPTGAGKGSTKETLELPDDIIEPNIDSLVEQNKGYKIEALELLKDKDLDDPNLAEKLKDSFFNIYVKYRFGTDCNSGQNFDYMEPHNNMGWKDSNYYSNKLLDNCENINDNKLKEGLNNKKDILLEMVGKSWPDWLFSNFHENIEKQIYDIELVWVTASMDELLKRNANRFNVNAKEFVKNNKNNAPRLTIFDKNIYIKDVNSIIKVFKENLRKYKTTIIDTTTRPPKKITDNINENTLENIIIKKKNVMDGGKRRTKRRTKRTNKRKKTKTIMKRRKTSNRKTKKRRRKR